MCTKRKISVSAWLEQLVLYLMQYINKKYYKWRTRKWINIAYATLHHCSLHYIPVNVWTKLFISFISFPNLVSMHRVLLCLVKSKTTIQIKHIHTTLNTSILIPPRKRPYSASPTKSYASITFVYPHWVFYTPWSTAPAPYFTGLYWPSVEDMKCFSMRLEIYRNLLEAALPKMRCNTFEYLLYFSSLHYYLYTFLDYEIEKDTFIFRLVPTVYRVAHFNFVILISRKLSNSDETSPDKIDRVIPTTFTERQ